MLSCNHAQPELNLTLIYMAKKVECVSLSLQELMCIFSTQRLKLTCIYQSANLSVAITKIVSFKRKREELLKLCLLNKSKYIKHNCL